MSVEINQIVEELFIQVKELDEERNKQRVLLDQMIELFNRAQLINPNKKEKDGQ